MTNKNVAMNRHTRRFLVVTITLCLLLSASKMAFPTKANASGNIYSWTKNISQDITGGYYSSVASSADGSHLLVASAEVSSDGPLYVSSNYGATWKDVENNADSGIRDNWQSVAVSDNGQTMVAVSDGGVNKSNSDNVNGKIVISHDAGNTWQDITPPGGTSQWKEVAISGIGTKIVAVADDDASHIYLSTDSGNNWTTSVATDSVGLAGWQFASISDNGNKVLVGGENNSDLNSMMDLSVNGGDTWQDVTPDTGGSGRIVTENRAALSSDGSKIAETTYGYNGDNWYGAVRTSTDNGADWTDVTPPEDNTANSVWNALAVSSNGKILTVLDSYNDSMYISSDYGSNWTQEDPDLAYSDADNTQWNSAAVSKNGTHFIVASSTNLYTGHDASIEQNSLAISGASGSPIKITTPSGTTITCHSSVKESSLAAQDGSYSYPLGLVDFCFSDTDATNGITLIFVTNLKPDQVVVRKYNSHTKKYSTITGATVTETTYGGHPALMVKYSITDNGPLDSNPVSGQVSDPVGLATQVGGPNTGLGSTDSNDRSLSIVALLSGISLAAGSFIARASRKKHIS